MCNLRGPVRQSKSVDVTANKSRRPRKNVWCWNAPVQPKAYPCRSFRDFQEYVRSVVCRRPHYNPMATTGPVNLTRTRRHAQSTGADNAKPGPRPDNTQTQRHTRAGRAGAGRERSSRHAKSQSSQNESWLITKHTPVTVETNICEISSMPHQSHIEAGGRSQPKYRKAARVGGQRGSM